MTEQWYKPISATAYDVLWEDVFGPQTQKPYVLDCESPGETTAKRAWIREQAYAELRKSGAPPDWLLNALARPAEAYSLRWDAARPVKMLAARQGNVHALAAIGVDHTSGSTTAGPVVWFGLTDEGGLLQALASRLPNRSPAKLRSQSVRLSSLARIGGEAAARVDEARRQPVSFLIEQFRACGETREASDAFARLAVGTSSGRGELTVSVGYSERRRTTGHKVMVSDVDRKLFLVVTKDDYVTIRGATKQDVIDVLYSELAELGRTVFR